MEKMQQRVIIIGGGLGGLALAQGLKNAQPPIPFHVFERDSSTSSRAQGYRVRICDDGLRAVLTPSLFASFEATSMDSITSGGAVNAFTAEPDPSAPMLGAPAHGSAKSYNVDRAVLRNVLLQGLQENEISFDKKFVKYEVLGDNSVQAHFSDGTVETGTFLVGADGARSLVRRQLLPYLPIVDTEGRAVFGKTDITDGLMEKLPTAFHNGMSLVGEPSPPQPCPSQPLKLLFEPIKFNPAARSLGLGVPADYIYWVLCVREDVLDPETRQLRSLLSLSARDSAKLAESLTQDWHESVRAIIDNANEGSTSTLAFLSCTTDGMPRAWKRLRRENVAVPVTLIGDSAHPVAPVAGVGASAAIQDAADLVDSMRSSETGSAQPGSVLTQYENAMVRRVQVAVEASSRGANTFFGLRPHSELKPVAM